MYEVGSILYFMPFYFKDLSPSKPKYFIVLKVLENGEAILSSLPSSRRYLPVSITTNHGCVEIPEACISCYILEANRPLTDEGWAFPLDTYLYGQYLDIYTTQILQEISPTEGVDYEILGKLSQKEFNDIIYCFANSSSVKRKIKRMLAS